MALSKLDLEQFLNNARIKLPGSSDAGVKVELYETVKEFLKDTNAWREDISLSVIRARQDYTLAPLEGGQVIRLEGVLDGQQNPVAATMPVFGKLNVRTPVQITTILPAAGDTVLRATNPWTVRVSKNVQMPTTSDSFPVVPSFLLQVYSGCILDGVLGRMMLQIAKSYSNKEMGIYHLKRFRDEISEAAGDSFRQNLFGGQRWTYPRQFSTSSQRGGSITTWPSERF